MRGPLPPGEIFLYCHDTAGREKYDFGAQDSGRHSSGPGKLVRRGDFLTWRSWCSAERGKLTKSKQHGTFLMAEMSTKMSMLLLLCERLGRSGSRGLPSIKNIVRTLFFRQGWYSNDHAELERIFRTLKDPWNFESSPYEQERLMLLLQEVKGCPHDSILEVGCAEGVFTSMLSTLSSRVVGIDVSPTAVARARERCPDHTFFATSLESFESDEKFDLVICAETLYYIEDVPKAIRKLSSLGRRCIVSYIQRESNRLDGDIKDLPGVEFRRYEIGASLLRRGMVAAQWETEQYAAVMEGDIRG